MKVQYHRTQRVIAGAVTLALASTLAISTSAASADALSESEGTTVAEVPSQDAAEFISEIVLADAATLPIEPGSESNLGVTVPISLEEPISVSTDRGTLNMAIPAADGAAASVSATGDVIVASENDGADLIVQELDTSSLSFEAAATRTLITIDSWDVDPLFTFSPEVPPGGSITLDEETGGVIVLDADGNASSVLSSPWAFDAEGTEVPTWYEVEGGNVYQYVDHIGRQYTYPVVADPVWVIPVLLFVGRIVLKEVVASTMAAAAAKAISGIGTVAKYRSWTDANKRHNMIIYTKKNPGTRCDVHHTLPQKFSTYFAGRGFTGSDSIHHPKYLVWWEVSDHRSKALAVNTMWGAWIKDHPTASKSAILIERAAVMRKYPPRC
ncbi:hypothetical protein [Microbacterium sp. PMB16]|uniref:hypothetical protein n=1 Tax=Microbacterium sp. PMB16 TaxID=3120157 RepID=UPI003F4B0E16